MNCLATYSWNLDIPGENLVSYGELGRPPLVEPIRLANASMVHEWWTMLAASQVAPIRSLSTNLSRCMKVFQHKELLGLVIFVEIKVGACEC